MTDSGKKYVIATPAGAYYTVQRERASGPRQFMLNLLQADVSPEQDSDTVKQWVKQCQPGVPDLVRRLSNMGFIQCIDVEQRAVDHNPSEAIPGLLKSIVDTGKAMLSDMHGNVISTSGVSGDAVSELAQMGSELFELRMRHGSVIANYLQLDGDAWALVNAGGNSETGFWPLYTGNNIYMLIVMGMPMFNQPTFTRLVKMLVRQSVASASSVAAR